MLVPGVWAKGTAAGTREINQHPGADGPRPALPGSAGKASQPITSSSIELLLRKPLSCPRSRPLPD